MGDRGEPCPTCGVSQARHPAPREDVEALIEAAESYRMASLLRIYEMENGDDWTYEGDREQDCDKAEGDLLSALARVKESTDE